MCNPLPLRMNFNFIFVLSTLSFKLHVLISNFYNSTYPLAMPPIRQAVSGLFLNRSHPTSWPLSYHMALSFVVLLLTFLFGNYVPVLEFVFGLTGATGGVMLVYILPAAISLKTRTEHTLLGTAFLWFMLVGGIALGKIIISFKFLL